MGSSATQEFYFMIYTVALSLTRAMSLETLLLFGEGGCLMFLFSVCS